MSKRDAWDDPDASRRRELNEKIELHMDEEMGTLYRDYDRARHTMSAGKRRVVMLAVILVCLLLAMLFFVPWGVLVAPSGGFSVPQWTYSPARYKELVIYNIGTFVEFVTTGGQATMGQFFCSILVIIAAGYAMSVTGAVYQGLFANPMASPTTMGVNAGGVLGGLVYIIFFYEATSFDGTFINESYSYTAVTGNALIEWYYSMNIFQRSAQSLCILAGCFLGVLLILFISMAAGRGKISTVALLLAGSVFSTVITEIGQLAQYYLTMYGDDEKAAAVSTLIGGNYLGSSFTWPELMLLGVPILAVSIIVFAMAGKINIIVFGEAEARAMGINLTRYRNLLIVLCTILSAFVLSFCGQVSMVGFLIPHLARYLVGPDFKKLIPASALLGGITTLLIYIFCYMMGATGSFNLYTGVVCSILSAIFIIFYRRNRHADWS